MISIWWLLPAAMAGTVLGIFAHALCMAGRDDDERGK